MFLGLTAFDWFAVFIVCVLIGAVAGALWLARGFDGHGAIDLDQLDGVYRPNALTSRQGRKP